MKSRFEDESVRHSRVGKWTALLYGASAFSLLTAMPAVAQEADESAEASAVETLSDEADDADEARQDTVVVQGIRSSLQSAQAIKRQADTFVDAVTAEDIGALPDRSVTEALQRVPGVTISRFAAADDPDHFSIEGQGVVVRGLTFVRSEFNGRDSFSANNGRGLSFSDVSPELLGSVQVFKNQTADLIEGGVSGTVNLVTRKPFDSPGSVIAGTAELNYGDFRKAVAPTFSLLASNRWETDIGEFGILINGVSSELQTRSDGTQASSFQPRDDLAAGRVWVPEGAAIRTQDYDRDRIGYGGSVQWRSPDHTWLATAEFLRSESTTSWTEFVSEIATDNIGDTAFFFVPGTEYGFNGDDLFGYGTISAPTGWRSDTFSDPHTPIYGLQSNNIRRDVEQEFWTQDASLNMKWTPNDRWAFNFDYQRIDAESSNVDFGIWGTTFQDIYLNLNTDVPEIVYLPPNRIPGSGGGNPSDVDCSGGPNTSTCPSYMDAPYDSFANPENSFWRAAMDHLDDNEGQEQAFRADVDYKFDEGSSWLKSVRSGVRWTEREQTTRFTTYNWGALSEIWGNNGPVWFDEIGAPEGVVSNFLWSDFQRGDVTQPPAFPYYNQNLAQNYLAGAAFADQVVAQWLANGGATGGPTGGSGGWLRLDERQGVIPGTPFLPSEINDTEEKTKSIYAMLNFGSDDPFGNGISIDGNIGVRYVETEFSSVGAYGFPDAATFLNDTGAAGPAGSNRCLPPTDLQPGQTYSPPGYCALSQAERDAIRAFSDGLTADAIANNSYENVLPSFNLKVGLNDEMIVRFAYSKGISRPDLGLMRNYFTLTPVTDDDPRTPEADAPPAGYSTGWYGFESSGGNPWLEPVEADNFDLSWEWYFDDVGSFTVSAFYKEIKNVIATGQGGIEFSNNGQTFNVFTRQPTNSDETGKVQGFEIAYQQFYDQLPGLLSGLGSQITYTYIDSTGVQSAGVSNSNTQPAANDATVDLGDLPLEGLSEHNYNIAAIYEKGPVSARLAYNWRSDYLVTPRDVITPFYPIFQESTGQLDGSFFYTLNENIKIGVQGSNLLDEVAETTSYIPNSDGRRGGRSWYRNDRRISLALRANF
ncbi:MAG: TonB-dependent receptor [Hyphomonas sp.]|uniref:TonB-dependent receptor n=1 Tax=Hyphomonas sp. TaxID=87 RepID=UPI003528A210